MTEVQVIPTAIDINTTPITGKRSVYGSVNARAALLSVSVSSSPMEKSFKPTVQSNGLLSPPAEDATFSPQLYQGHPDIHIRQGIIRAALAADAQKTNAEAAFFVADLSQVYRQHLRWKACLPNVEPFYGMSSARPLCIQNDVIYVAVKANPDPFVLRLLAALGTGFDCASQNEINTVLGMGNVDPSRIIFANPCKAISFIRHAARAQVDKMTFDNTDELYKIARTHPGAKLVVRILADDSKSLCRLGLKFGVPLVMVPALLAKARELGLDVIGVSFHVGSGCYDSSAFADAIMRARAAFDMGREAGYAFDFLDVGGGFEDADFEETAAVLNTALDKYFPDRTNLKVIAEPGRFYVSRAFTLATNIIARRAKAPSDCARDDASSASEEPSVMCTSLAPISISGPPKIGAC